MCFRPPEKTQSNKVKLFMPTAQLSGLLGMAALGLLWSIRMLWKPRWTASQAVHIHLHTTWSLLTAGLCICSFFSFFICCILSKSGFRYTRVSKTEQVSPELPCQLSGETCLWLSARICTWEELR